MSLASLKHVLPPALAEGRAVMAVTVLGWEDAQAFVAAAEEVGCAVILQAGPKFRQNLPLPVSAAMFRHLAHSAKVPVVAHIDHAQSIEECRAGIEAGFTSVMFDGSALSLDDNIAATAAVVELARPLGVSVEAEVGFVGHATEQSAAAASRMTRPEDAARLAQETDIDALAVSIGNTHLQQSPTARIDLDRLAAIESVVHCPLVIHGASGVPPSMRRHLALHSKVCKFNIGTELRQCFGASLRSLLAQQPHLFDRGEILRATQPPLQSLTAQIMRSFLP